MTAFISAAGKELTPGRFRFHVSVDGDLICGVGLYRKGDSVFVGGGIKRLPARKAEL